MNYKEEINLKLCPRRGDWIDQQRSATVCISPAIPRSKPRKSEPCCLYFDGKWIDDFDTFAKANAEAERLFDAKHAAPREQQIEDDTQEHIRNIRAYGGK